MTDAADAAAIDVVVPSYERPRLLERCLAALARQSHRPARVVVAARPDDDATIAIAQSAAHLDVIVADAEPGVIAALRAGVATTTASRVAFTDDDALPDPDWTARIVEHLDTPGVGVVGGRDVIPGQEHPRRSEVGTWAGYGRTVGDHHLGFGPARAVDVVKGVNMAFRVDALALPRAGVLQGGGAECHGEMLMCWWARQHGWTVLFDPAVRVEHRVVADLEPSVAIDDRRRRDARAVADCASNWVIATTALARGRWPIQVAYGLGVGSRAAPGLVRGAIGVVRGEADVRARFGPSLRGQLRGARAGWQRSAHPDAVMVSAHELRADG